MHRCGTCDRFPEGGPSEVVKLGSLDVSKHLFQDIALPPVAIYSTAPSPPND